MGLGLRYVAVIGSRNAPRSEVLAAFHELKLAPKHHIIVSGDCKHGGDRWAKQIAEEWGFHYIGVPAFWSRGKHAGHARNPVIADIADAVVAVWDGQSGGTKGTIDHAEKFGKKVHIHHFVPEIDEKTQQVVHGG